MLSIRENTAGGAPHSKRWKRDSRLHGTKSYLAENFAGVVKKRFNLITHNPFQSLPHIFCLIQFLH